MSLNELFFVQRLSSHSVSLREAWWLKREAWWLNGNAPDCCLQPTADCQSPGGLPPGMALGCGLTTVRGNRGENYENEPLVRQKHIKEKNSVSFSLPTHMTVWWEGFLSGCMGVVVALCGKSVWV